MRAKGLLYTENQTTMTSQNQRKWVGGGAQGVLKFIEASNKLQKVMFDIVKSTFILNFVILESSNVNEYSYTAYAIYVP